MSGAGPVGASPSMSHCSNSSLSVSLQLLRRLHVCLCPSSSLFARPRTVARGLAWRRCAEGGRLGPGRQTARAQRRGTRARRRLAAGARPWPAARAPRGARWARGRRTGDAFLAPAAAASIHPAARPPASAGPKPGTNSGAAPLVRAAARAPVGTVVPPAHGGALRASAGCQRSAANRSKPVTRQRSPRRRWAAEETQPCSTTVFGNWGWSLHRRCRGGCTAQPAPWRPVVHAPAPPAQGVSLQAPSVRVCSEQGVHPALRPHREQTTLFGLARHPGFRSL